VLGASDGMLLGTSEGIELAAASSMTIVPVGNSVGARDGGVLGALLVVSLPNNA
jgi:hypothetical protein